MYKINYDSRNCDIVFQMVTEYMMMTATPVITQMVS